MIGKKRGSYALLCTAQNLGAVCPPRPRGGDAYDWRRR